MVQAGVLLALAGHAHALQITSLTPQGEVARVRQIVAKFDEPAVRFGDPKAAAPLTVSCADARAGKGNGRWTGDKQWVFDFENDLPPGMRCTVTRVANFSDPAGNALTGPARYQFTTGGPFVRFIVPSGGKIDEQQAFLLELNGAATTQSIRDNVWCAVEGMGERIPVRLLDADQRAALLASTGHTQVAARDPDRFVTFQCNRTLTAASRVQIVYGKGVATPTGVANSVEKRFSFQVREPFAASFTCERENAQAGCLPLRPMELRFNAPVARTLATQIRLKGDSKTLEPKFPEGSAGDDLVESIRFEAPFAELAQYTVELPSGFKDASERPLGNPGVFPMKVKTGAMPPLAKFAASPFGVIERLAEPEGGAMMPVTVRRVEPALAMQALTPGKVSDINPKTDAEIIAWFRKVRRYENSYAVPRKQARADIKGELPKVIDKDDRDNVQSRMLSLLGGQPGVKTLDMPKANSQDPRPFEVIGIPLTPGFHVLEIASQKLGESLLDERYGNGRTMYVRTSALATNLAVHFKLGRENSLAWVTTLDKGKVVAGAKVRVSGCNGKEVATGTTDANGIARLEGIDADAPTCSGAGNADDGESGDYSNAYFVSARATDDKGVEDLAFTWSDWQRGIEPWRFNVPTSSDGDPDVVAHTVFDRALFRAGETVSMKHLIRTQTNAGFGVPKDLPGTLTITHSGSGQTFTQPVTWRTTATGGKSAENVFAVPTAAKLGVYEVQLSIGSAGDVRRAYATGQFRVEEFRLPVLEGRIAPTDKKPLVAVTSLPTDVQINYVSGGGASNLPVRVSAMMRRKSVNFADYEMFNFSPPRRDRDAAASSADEESESDDARVVADKQPLTLDRNGAGKLTLDPLPTAKAPRDLLLEATYADPNGEVQTLRSTQTVWPADVIAGVKTEGWVSTGQKLKFQALALDLSGKPQAGVPVEVKAVARITTTSRKRMVGGFYTYDNKTETRDLGTVCSGKSDSRGLVLCDASLKEPGNVELVVVAKDKEGRESLAAASIYVTRQGELWFGGEDHDRIDVLPEKKSYQPGETAKVQVRMPFRFATALVAVEREGIIETQVVQLNGQDPTVNLQIKDSWGPNVYVSVLALRGRLREVPWYSFFTWGFKAPREWWTAFWYEGREYVAPTAMVDLSKPAYRLGVAEIRVGTASHQIDVKVASDKPTYTVRGKAQVTITGKLPDGKPAAGAEVALAVVDQALLELMPNTSWNLLDAMLTRRSWGVSTSTAQMEIVGRRHYGRKAVPAGGGGGKSATRELLDTLLLWSPRVLLDANGQATITVPLNDALTTFRIVAVADSGTQLFGTGQASIQTTQDLQIISGLPPLVREDDQFRAQITLRNTTQKAMKVEAAPRATLLTLQPQTIEIPPGEAREVAWTVTAPAQLAQTRAESILWEIDARDTLGDARDALKVRQRIVPAVPLTVQQATLVRVDEPFSLDVAPPADALPGRGGLKLALQPKLADGMPGVRDWFANYPFSCLEQKTSKSIGLRDAKMWQGVVAQLPSYLDSDGLANYFPPRDGEANRGSDILTSYLLAATDEASAIDPAFALPDDARAPMESGLIAFVEGRIQREFWSPQKDLDVRKLAALEALSRYGKAQGRMTGSITIAPNQWPTSAVIDWVNILKRVKDVPQRQQRMDEAGNVLKSRLSYQGTKVVFSTERDDYWYWLMANGDVNAARLLLTVMDDPAWKDDIGKLANGFIGRQRNGAWHTTTANLWGGLALDKFSKAFESEPVTGSTNATLGAAPLGNADSTKRVESVEWSRVERVKASDPSGAPGPGTWFGAPASPGDLRNNAMFLPWKPGAAKETLTVTQNGGGKPWLTLQSVAAVQLKAPFAAGYAIKKTVTPVEQANPGQYTRGDVLRVTLEVNASADMTWVAITDPIPGGATILGSGLGRDSQIATQGEKRSGGGWPAFEERSFEAFRSYYDYLPKGVVKVEYTVRLNNAGDFALPPSRVEALYAPEMFGESPNARVKVEVAK
ncbi:MG2 domain-containing protein [Variovorax sp. J22R133]|uniref:Ig-like domain-containing alpha-2-macroglobulin family protein n=1 Tax=Variovorax brevis TaxID=3053503 RepID=UPI002579141E|nr:Ig-like domain-containing alpha-2-macroglobulin family protein [Variovorax sp. J22R133]MDM0114256.1 MG2 domain-containing protein [Variovorax sp. J22R133]